MPAIHSSRHGCSGRRLSRWGGLLRTAKAYEPSAFHAFNELASILVTLVVIGGAVFLGAALGGWFVAVVGVVTRAEATRARDGRQLLLLSLNTCWVVLAWPCFAFVILLNSNGDFGRASRWIAFCVAPVPTVVVMRIRRNRDRERTWLRALARAAEDTDDDEDITSEFAIEPVERFADAEQIPPYLTDSRGRYTGVLVLTDETTGARRILGRVR